MRWGGDGPPTSPASVRPEATHPRLGSGSPSKYRPEAKLLSLGDQEHLSLSLSHSSFLPPSTLFMPITLSIPLRAKLLETKGWKPLFFCPPPLHTLPEGKGKGKEEKMLHASTIMSCTIFSCAVMASDDFFPVAEPVCARATLWGWKRT